MSRCHTAVLLPVGLLLVAWQVSQVHTATAAPVPTAGGGDVHVTGRRPLSGKWGLFNYTATYTYVTPSAKRTKRFTPAPPPATQGSSATGKPASSKSAAAPTAAGSKSAASAAATAPAPFDISIVNANNGGASSTEHEVLTQVYENGKLVATATLPAERNASSKAAVPAPLAPPASSRQLKQLGGRFINNLAYSYSFSTKRYNIAVQSGPADPKEGNGGGNGTSSGGKSTSGGSKGDGGSGSSSAASSEGGGGDATTTVAAPVAAPIRINIVNIDNTRRGNNGRHSSILSLSQGGVPIVTVPLGGADAESAMTSSSKKGDPPQGQSPAVSTQVANSSQVARPRATAAYQRPANSSTQSPKQPVVMSTNHSVASNSSTRQTRGPQATAAYQRPANSSTQSPKQPVVMSTNHSVASNSSTRQTREPQATAAYQRPANSNTQPPKPPVVMSTNHSVAGNSSTKQMTGPRAAAANQRPANSSTQASKPPVVMSTHSSVGLPASNNSTRAQAAAANLRPAYSSTQAPKPPVAMSTNNSAAMPATPASYSSTRAHTGLLKPTTTAVSANSSVPVLPRVARNATAVAPDIGGGTAGLTLYYEPNARVTAFSNPAADGA